MSTFGSGQYTDVEWEMVTELATRLGVGERIRREAPRANADLILDVLGYSPAWSVDATLMFADDLLQQAMGQRIEQRLTSCRRCGAVVALRKPEQGHLAPVDQHTHWHARTEGVIPSGRKVT